MSVEPKVTAQLLADPLRRRRLPRNPERLWLEHLAPRAQAHWYRSQLHIVEPVPPVAR